MPAFPSYYLSNLERKRQRSKELREGLSAGIEGAVGGIDRLAQLQMALEGKKAEGAAAAEKKAADEAKAKTAEEHWQAEHALNVAREERAGKAESDRMAQLEARLNADIANDAAERTARAEKAYIEEGRWRTEHANDAAREAQRAAAATKAAPNPLPFDVGKKKSTPKPAAPRRSGVGSYERVTGGGKKPPKDTAPQEKEKPPKETAQQVNRRTAMKSAKGNLERAMDAFERYQSEADKSMNPLPSSGLGESLRDIPGIRGGNPQSRTEFKTYAEAVNAALFPIIGRSDAPADQEIKRLAAAIVEGGIPADDVRTRMKVLMEMLTREERESAPQQTTPTNAAPSAPIPDDDRW